MSTTAVGMRPLRRLGERYGIGRIMPRRLDSPSMNATLLGFVAFDSLRTIIVLSHGGGE